MGRKITLKTLPPLMGIQHSHRKGIFAIIKDQNIPITTQSHCRRSPSAAVIHCPTAGRPPHTTSIKCIFQNLSNILKNSICTPNTPKILCSTKLFLKIAFLGILFLGMKIYSIYQTPRKRENVTSLSSAPFVILKL